MTLHFIVDSRLKSSASDQMASRSAHKDWKPKHCSMKGAVISRREAHVARSLEMCRKYARGRCVGGRLCVFSMQAGNASIYPAEQITNNRAFELLNRPLIVSEKVCAYHAGKKLDIYTVEPSSKPEQTNHTKQLLWRTNVDQRTMHCSARSIQPSSCSMSTLASFRWKLRRYPLAVPLQVRLTGLFSRIMFVAPD